MLKTYQAHYPTLSPSARVFENAVVVGQVTLDRDVGVWHNATLRADMAPIVVGEGSNIQDNTVIHTDEGQPTTIGRYVTVGHRALLHACTVEDHALIGMGAIVLNGAVIEEGAMIAAGSLVPPGKRVPKYHLAMGSPIKVIRALSEDEIHHNHENAQTYIKLKNQHG